MMRQPIDFVAHSQTVIPFCIPTNWSSTNKLRAEPGAYVETSLRPQKNGTPKTAENGSLPNVGHSNSHRQHREQKPEGESPTRLQNPHA